MQSLQRCFEGIDKHNDLFELLSGSQNIESNEIKRSCINWDLAFKFNMNEMFLKILNPVPNSNRLTNRYFKYNKEKSTVFLSKSI